MNPILFVSNGHGEEAIAARIASEVAAVLPEERIDHVALVGEFGHPAHMHDVGPRRPMPSGGLLAMGNLRNIARDVRGGLIGLTLEQRRFLRDVRGKYACVVAVGDTFALMMALQARAPTVFVGTAKSVYVTPYGPFEERVLRRAEAVFVRDEATATRLRRHGVDAVAPGNAIADLFVDADDPLADTAMRGFDPVLVLFPGSRGETYAEGRALIAAIRPLLRERPMAGAIVSIAPGIDAARFAAGCDGDGVRVVAGDERLPFALVEGGREIVRAWRGPIGPLLSRARLVIGQAGTANEAAAAAGIPVVALELGGARKSSWYRKRQRGLLGDALSVVPPDPREASARIGALLDDGARRARMSAAGRERMGAPGGARAIAQHIAKIAEARG
jgi:uncharacterized protein (TIGR03492 family)